jgi:hypothetical protein
MNHLNELYELFTGAGLFSAGAVAGIVVPILTAAAMRRWWGRARLLTRAATLVAALPASLFVLLILVAPPASSGWDFVVGFVLFAVFSLPTWLVFLGVGWLVLFIRCRRCAPPTHARPEAVDGHTLNTGAGA